jgi:prolyl-tRNA synthetase
VAGVAAAQAAGGTRPDLGWFGRMLEQDEVVDLRTVALPGAAVTLPWGVALLRRFRQLLEPIFDACGYEEYELPDLAPEAVYEPALRAFPHHQHLLRAGDDGDWAVGRPRAVLAPTGEATVYAHWERTVRTSADLPIRLRRNARYFRPVPRGSRSGRGIFRPLEAPEVHEFHACFADRGAARAGLAQALEMVEQAGRALRVPVLWSTRPPWTNHADVADIAFGGDALLPSGGAVQVGCVYDQGQRFSRAYGIRLRDRNPPVHPFQVTGCVTRRLLLVHLFQHMTGSGELRLHPQVAPVQVAVHSTGDWPHRAFADALCAAGLRVTSAVHPDRRAAKAFDQRWRRRGVPVRVLVQPPRSDSDSTRVVLSRHTGRPEQVFHLASASHAVDAVADAVNAVGRELDAELSATVRRRVVPVADSPIADTLARRDVAVTPLQPTRAAVEALEGKYPGEVLGLQRGAEAAVCPVTGEQTTVRAFLAGRT